MHLRIADIINENFSLGTCNTLRTLLFDVNKLSDRIQKANP